MATAMTKGSDTVVHTSRSFGGVRRTGWRFCAASLLAVFAACSGGSSPSAPSIVSPGPASGSGSVAPSAAATDHASRIDSLLGDLAQKSAFSGSILVAKDDTIVISKGYGLADREAKTANTPKTRFRLASITKSFTAIGILQLQQQGKLRVEDPICTYLPDCPTTWKSITIHHVLTHT
jgi:CubicO group peptidase (beta-lactamase class C family)